MKKILSLILALLMSASCAATIFADEAEATSAIAEDAPAAEEEVVAEAETEYDLALEFLKAKKIMIGKEDGLLHAEDPVKRYEMAFLAARISTGWVTNDEWMNGVANDTKFTDLAESAGAQSNLGALSYANQKGIVVGYEDGSFKPENTVTYRDALAMAVRTLGYSGSYPWGIIEKAVSLDLTKDITGVAYTDPATRGVVAQIIYNALFAKTADGTTLAKKSFNCEYKWETIVVIADDKAVYELGGKEAASGLVSFKLVNTDGTFDSEVYSVKADLEFGAFYNALFEKKGDLVDLIKAIEIEPTVISNRGDDLEKTDAIGDYLKNLTVVEKYNVKTLNKGTFYDDEIILKGVQTKEILVGYKTPEKATYAIEWATGNILKLNDKGEYVIEWYYYDGFGVDTYFRYYGDNDATEDGEYYIGCDIMDEKDLAELKDAIKATYEVKKAYTGYTKIDKPAKYNAYADLTVYDVNDNAYATYESYFFGKYEGQYAADKCGDCSTDKVFKLANTEYLIEGTCSHKYQDTWTITELTAGYTGYVIYGLNTVTNEAKIIKEFPAFSADLTENTYYTYGIVRGFNADKNEVTIGDAVYSYAYAGLEGLDPYMYLADENAYFNTLFNQFVKFYVLDGKIVKIDCEGGSTTDYLVVEKYLGIDADGYIVVYAYNTADCKLATYRIGAYDGWKQGSYFFYGNEEEIAEDFDKGVVYQITSTDTTEANGPVFYVTSLGLNAGTKDITIKIEDMYRTVNTTTKKMTPDDKYVIIGERDQYGFKPVYLFKGIANDGWTVTGKSLVNEDKLYIIDDATVVGFNADSYKVGFVAFTDKVTYDKVYFDGYKNDFDYYYYGATEYAVKGFNLLTAEAGKTYKGYNLDLEAGKIYVTIDDQILDNAIGMDWEGFTNAAPAAYADEIRATADYFFFTYDFTKTTDAKELSTYLSSEKIDGVANPDYFYKTKTAHDDLLEDGLNTQKITLTDGDLTKVEGLDLAKVDWDKYESIPAFCFVVTGAKDKVIAYLNLDGADKVDVKADATVTGTDKIEVATNAYITTTATGTTTKNDAGNVVAATIDTISFEFTGTATKDVHNAIDLENLHFGEAGVCTIENWRAQFDVQDYATSKEDFVETPYEGSIVATLYGPEHECNVVDCDLVKSVKFELATPVAVSTTKWQTAQVWFWANEMDEDGDLATTKYLLTVSFIIEDGKLVYNFDKTNGLNKIDGVDATFYVAE